MSKTGILQWHVCPCGFSNQHFHLAYLKTGLLSASNSFASPVISLISISTQGVDIDTQQPIKIHHHLPPQSNLKSDWLQWVSTQCFIESG